VDKLLSSYFDVVDFLADFLGPDSEVVLHDVTNLENSVVAIRNNHISGRNVGAPATDLVLKILKDEKFNDYRYLTNYEVVSPSGRTLKSATYPIKDEKGKIIGMLCINTDIEALKTMKNYLDKMMGPRQSIDDEPILETLSQSTKELTLSSIKSVIAASNIPPERMSQEEKISIIEQLNDKGIFLIKGAVSEAASALKVSEASVYRYLSKLKKT